jgi:putative copper export protein
MNTTLAFVVGGVLLFIVGRSTYKVWKMGSAELSAADRRLAPVIVAAVLVLFLVGVLSFHLVHP